MLAIAGGDLQAPLPKPGPDELGQMTEALRVFRNTAVEVDEQRLRERQVVLDTIDYGVLNSRLRVASAHAVPCLPRSVGPVR